jgi:DNA polymerase V
MTSDARNLVRAARACVEASWPQRGGPYAFAKSGVMLDDLVAEADRPRTLFDVADEGKGRSPAVMATLNAVNARFGKKTMVLGSEGVRRAWAMRAALYDPDFGPASGPMRGLLAMPFKGCMRERMVHTP